MSEDDNNAACAGIGLDPPTPADVARARAPDVLLLLGVERPEN